MKLTAIFIPEPEGGYTASNPETGTTSQGETIDEALANLQEATELFLEEFPTEGRRTLTSSSYVRQFKASDEVILRAARKRSVLRGTTRLHGSGDRLCCDG